MSRKNKTTSARRTRGLAAIVTVALVVAGAPASAHDDGPPTPVEDGAAPTAEGGGVFQLEFAAPLSGADREALAADGITLGAAIPPSTYVARLAPGAATAAAAHADFVGLEPLAPSDKLSPALRGGSVPAHARALGNDDVMGAVEFFGDVTLAEALAAADAAGVTVVDRTAFLVGYRLALRGTAASLDQLAADATVLYVSEAPPPPETTNLVAQQLSNVDDIQVSPGLTGSGVDLGVWDGGPVLSTHSDLTGRVNVNEGTGSHFHATHVGGTMIGDGSGNAAAEGMAPAATLESYDFNGDIPTEMTTAATTQGIVASNHSWGYSTGYNPSTAEWFGEGGFGTYSTISRDWDNVVRATDQIIVKSSGNDRNDCGFAVDPTGDCDGFLGADGQYYDNIAWHGNAKNVITVGAIEDDGTTITSFSSAGPSDDDRIKPDVVANGSGLFSTWNDDAVSGCSGLSYCSISGTSMATPVVSGTVALLEEHHRSLYGGQDLPADLARAALVNGATDLGRTGPDYLYGYGRVDASFAVADLGYDRNRHGNVAAGATAEFEIQVSPGAPELRTTLNWIDPGGVANSAADDIVNNLDLVLEDPIGGLHYPFSGPGRANPTGLATATGPNTVDTVEHVRVASPMSGTWTARISGTSVPVGPQDFAIVSGLPFQAPVISPGGGVIAEGDSGTSVVAVDVTLDMPTNATITVDYDTIDTGAPGIATEGVDYVAANGTLTFNPGETTKTINLTVIGDVTDEPPAFLGEWALILLSNPSYGSIDPTFFGLGVVIIVDDDDAPVISRGGAVIAEGDVGNTNFTVELTLSNPSANTITVDFASLDTGAPGVATLGVDYLGHTSLPVTFLPGETSQLVSMAVVGDTIDEPPLLFGEWGLYQLFNPVNSTVDPAFFGLGVFIIIDDDP